MGADPSRMTDPKQVRQLMLNAERLNATELATACRRRLFELSGTLSSDASRRPLPH